MATLSDTSRRAPELTSTVHKARNSLIEARQEEAKQEASQQADYQAWMSSKVEEFHARLKSFIVLLHLAMAVEKSWRDLVFTGQIQPTKEENEAFQNLYTLWLGSALFEERATYLMRHSKLVETSLKHLQQAQEEARASLLCWETPQVAKSPSFRTPKLSEKASERLYQVLAEGRAKASRAHRHLPFWS